ncbi:TauD/TfdA family dioxygenase [Alphaproteobacteria bacterium]|nr:TauD/TfdA family dioxygenase [Alphaproteobacteria bacterium]
MPVTVTPFTAPLGAEITGIDLCHDLNDDSFALIEAAWHEYGVIIIRDQDLAKEDQLAFANRLGPVGPRGLPANKRNEVDDYGGAIMLITNKRGTNGEFIGSVPEGELWFHSDLSYQPVPHKATLLHAIALPTSGGNTMFANMYKAYENVPEALKQKLAGRKVLHAYDFATTQEVNIDDGLDKIQHCWQPIFIRHPVTGRTALYVNRLMSAQIDGLDSPESDAILQELFAIGEDKAIIYEHVWHMGDLVICDNRCCIHARHDFPQDQLRMLQRCTVRGETMIAAAT